MHEQARALNEAAYAALRAAQKAGSPMAEAFKRIARATDEAVDALPPAPTPSKEAA